MAALILTGPTSMPAPRIRRKPVPSADPATGPVLALDILTRYPAPDPNDPFAPLSVLRSRSSTLQGRVESTPFPRPPFYGENRASSSSEDVLEPLKLPIRVFTQTESHYRRRSQSIAILSSSQLASPTAVRGPLSRLTPTPCSSDTELDTSNLSACPSSASRGRMARIFMPRKASNTSMNSTTRCGDQRRRRKVSVASISSPMPSPVSTITATDRSLSTRASLDSRHLPLRVPHADAGYYSQPETLSPSLAFPKVKKRLVHSQRSTLVPPVVRPSTPTRSGRIPVPPATPTRSETSSYVNVSTPTQSHDDHDASTESSVPSHTHSQSLPTNLPSTSAISNEWMLPTPTQLNRAASLPLIAPSGLRVPFGAVFAHKRSIIVFIRHFWCPLCQDYMSSLASLTPRDANVVVIGNGSPALIDKYKAIFGARFEMYVDPGMEVYRSLGMSTTGDIQCKKETHTGYVRRGTLGGIAMVVLRALRVGMPVWEKGGEIGQLGGEFVLGPGMTCSWAHRMQTVKGHAPVPDVLAAAGVSIQQPVTPISRAKRRESMAPTGVGVRTSVSWSVDDRRTSLTIEEQWIRAGYMKKSVGSRHVVEDREESHRFVEEPEDEVILFKE